MADDKKPQAQPEVRETTEKQAFDANGKLKAGFAYRYEPYRDPKTGVRSSRKVVFKVGS